MIKDYRTVGEAPQMGRNLFVKADTYLSTWGGTMFAPFSNFTESGYSSAFDFVGTGGFEVRYLEMDLMDGQEYTLAFDFTTPDYTQYTAGQGIRLELRKDISDASNINSTNIVQTKSLPYVAGTTRQTFTFTAPSSKLWICINFGYVADAQVAKRFTFANFKTEFGPTATAWTKAPEDSVNLFTNSAFGDGTKTGWTAGVVSPDMKYNGYATVKLTPNTVFNQSIVAPKLKASTTYTLSCYAKYEGVGATGEFGLYNEGTNAGNGYSYYPAGSAEWQRYTRTFTTASNVTSLYPGWYFHNSRATGTVWVTQFKLEEGATATEWTPAPEDTAKGTDRIVIARGQKTIVDWNDTLQIQAMISANQQLSQKYEPSTEKYTPDWTQSNMVLTASLFKANTVGNIIDDGNVKSIKWYRVAPGFPEVEVVSDASTWTVNGKTATRKDNLRPEVPTMGIRAEIIYTDPISTKDIMVQASMTFNLAVDAGGLTQAVMTMNGSPQLKNGKPVFVQSESQDYGKNLLSNSSFRWNSDNWYNGSTATTRVFETKSLFNACRVDGAFNTSKLTTQSLMGKLAPGETYTVSGYVLVENIVKGTTNPYLSIYLEGSYNNAGTSTWFQLGNADINSTYVGWQYLTKTFVADAVKVPLATSMTISSYLRDFTGSVWFRDFKLEKGSVATPWSIAPTDRPSLTQSTGQDKWLWRRYNVPTNFPTRAPVYADVKDAIMNDEMIVSDKASIYNSDTGQGYEYYIGYLGTSVYVPKARSLPISYHADDSVSVYINNARIDYSPDGVLASDRSVVINLSAGWNTLEFMYLEKGGADGIWNFATTQKQVIRDAANLDAYTENPGNLYGTKQGDGLYRFDLKTEMQEIISPTMVSVLQGSQYVMSFLLRTDSTDLSFGMVFSDGTTEIFAPMSVDLGVAHSTSVNGSFSPIAIDMGDGTKKVYASFTANNTMLKPFTLKYFSFTTGTYLDLGYPKLELGSYPTEFSKAPEDVAPSILKTHVEKVNSFYVTPFETYLNNLTLTCNLYKASVIDTTSVMYQWYKKDDTVTTSQGGGVGWLKLTGSSTESGYNLSTLVVPGTAVNETEVYKCVITDTDSQSSTYNRSFEEFATVVNIVDPVRVEVVSTNGYQIHNGQGGTSLTAKIWRNDLELDMAGTEYTYKWYRYNKDAVKDTTWNTLGYKSGKTLEVSATDILEKATFSVEVED